MTVPGDADGFEVRARVPFAMHGSTPLSLTEWYFTADGLYLVTVGSFSPLFGLGRGAHRRRAEAVETAYERAGLAGVLSGADSVEFVSFDALDSVTLSDGGPFTRPKLAVDHATGRQSVRLHTDRPFEDVATAVERAVDGVDVSIERTEPLWSRVRRGVRSRLSR